MFSSVPRQLAQRLCGWGIFLPEDLAAFSDACARRGEHTRAAAVSAFCLEMGGALTALQRGARAAEEAGDAEGAANLTFVRMALAGFTEQKEGEWRDTARQSLDNMADPYSRALFSFLTASEGDHTYAAVLDEPGLFSKCLEEKKIHRAIFFYLSLFSNYQVDELLTSIYCTRVSCS